MSKSLSGSGSVDLTVNSLQFIDVTATNISASSNLTTTTLQVNGDASIVGNLALGSIPDVEEQILNSNILAGVGLEKVEGSGSNADTINFIGGDIGAVSITTSGNISSTNITSLTNTVNTNTNSINTNTNSINTNTSNITSLTNTVNTNTNNITTNTNSINTNTSNITNLTNNKQDNIPLITTNTATNLVLSRSDNITSTLEVNGKILVSFPTSEFNNTPPIFDCRVPSSFNLGINTSQFVCEGTASTANVSINDSNGSSPVSHSFNITQDANASFGLNLELEAGGDINLKNSASDKNITLSTNNTARKHLVCDATNLNTELYYNNNKKLETTNTGINITGEVDCDGVLVNGSIQQSGSSNTNTFFGDVIAVKSLQYADTEGNAGTLQNVKTKIDSKQDLLSNSSIITVQQLNIVDTNQQIKANTNQLSLIGNNSNGIGFYTNNNNGDGDEILKVKADGNVELKDNHKLQFGDSSDLNIYHDSNNSYIEDTGTGALTIKSNNNIVVRSPSFNVQSSSNENLLIGTENSSVDLYHNNALRAKTTALGFEVRGNGVFGEDGNLIISSISNPQHSFGNETIKLQTCIDNGFRNDSAGSFSNNIARYLLALQPEYGCVSIGANSNSENPSLSGLGNGKLCIGFGNTANSSTFTDPAISIAGDTAGNGAIQINCQTGGKRQDGMSIRAISNLNHIINFCNTSNVIRGKIRGNNANSVEYSTSSDRRLKENIEDMDSQINNIMNIQCRKFNFIEDGASSEGFIAQEIHTIYPNMKENYNETYCSENENYDDDCPCDENGQPFYYGLDYGLFTPYIIKAFQEFKDMYDNKIAELETRIEALENN